MKKKILITIVSVITLVGLIRVNASTNVTPKSYNNKVEYQVGECLTSSCEDYVVEDIKSSSWFTGDYTNFCPNGKTCKLRKIWYETIYSTSLDAGRTYTINFDTWISDRDTLDYYLDTQFSFIASNTGSYNGSSSNYISTFSCKPGLIEGTTTRVSWSCSFTTSTQINYLYIRLQFPYSKKSFYSFGGNKGQIIYDNSQTDAINQQTQIIKDQTDKINDTLTQNHDYNTNPSESTENEKQEMENYEQEEDSLRNGLDLSIEESEITINPEANTFIWNIVNRLRGMSGKIVLLFTSVLSLGIMKMILGR